MLQSIASWGYVQCKVVCCSGLPGAAVCYSVLQCVAAWCIVSHHGGMCNARQCTAVCCRVLPYVAVYCSVFQCIVVCSSVLHGVAKYLKTAPRFLQTCVSCVCGREGRRERVRVCVCVYGKIHRVRVRFYILQLLNIF